jgi:hypothetical protein
MKEQHLLVDFENVQPGMEDLLKIAPQLTDVWLFHGPNQTKRAEQLKAVHERVTLVPHSGKGKNALDFHLTFYLGYVAAKHPDATLLVVANDKGYDSMLGHAELLGFTATRVGFKEKAASATKKAAPAKKPVAKKKPAKKASPAAKVVAPAKKPVAKKAPAKKAATVQGPAKAAPAAKKVAAKKMPVKSPAAKKQPAPPAAAAPADKVLARAKTALTKMGKNRPSKLASLLRHLKSIVGQGATDLEADALSHRLEEAKVIQVVGDLVLYP